MQAKFLSLLLIFAAPLLSQAQLSLPFAELEYEVIPIDQSAASEIESQIGPGAQTVRVYLRIPEFWECQSIFGDFFNPWSISSNTGFYQNEFGGPTTFSINEEQLGVIPGLAYDSWITIGAENNTDNLLQVVSLPTSFSEFEAGGNLNVSDIVGAIIFVATESLEEQNTIDANGRILISQFTSTGSIDACYNIQLRRLNSDGTIFDPPGTENSETVLFSNLCINIPAPEGPAPTCALFDADNSGFIGVGDLLGLLAAFGCNQNCAIDINNDDDTGAEELLFFLSIFGSPCE